MKKIGLVINPIAGMGGRVGLKGTDGEEILKRAIDLGAIQESPIKAKKALDLINKSLKDFIIYTYPHYMGEYESRDAGIENVVVLGESSIQNTTSKDTMNAVKDFLLQDVDIILFAGGDGTARDIYSIVGSKVPVIGIPAGVKIHSAVYATNASNAGRTVVEYLNSDLENVVEAEVMDIDEDQFRNGIVTAKLFGYMKIPNNANYTQTKKFSNPMSDKMMLKGMSQYIIDEMEDHVFYIVGSGSTTKAILDNIGIDGTLLGIDIIKNKKIVKKDATEKEILEIITGQKSKIIITPIGGQGYILGRGNQQISSDVVSAVGKENIIVVATSNKLFDLRGKPLLVDTGDEKTDKYLKGFYKIIIGYGETYVYECVY